MTDFLQQFATILCPQPYKFEQLANVLPTDFVHFFHPSYGLVPALVVAHHQFISSSVTSSFTPSSVLNCQSPYSVVVLLIVEFVPSSVLRLVLFSSPLIQPTPVKASLVYRHREHAFHPPSGPTSSKHPRSAIRTPDKHGMYRLFFFFHPKPDGNEHSFSSLIVLPGPVTRQRPKFFIVRS